MLDLLIQIIVIAFCIIFFLGSILFIIYWLRILWEIIKLSLK